MYKRILLSLILLITLSFSIKAQDDYVSEDRLIYDDHIYKNYIKSVKLNKLDIEISMPFIQLNSNEQLLLRFDDLSGNEKNYSYTFVLCDFNWQPADLMTMEYLDGIETNYINNYEYSYNTTVDYANYQLVFPNENVQFSKSGNYLLKVFIDDNPDSVVITQRFYVYEDILPIEADVIMSRDPMYRNYKQEINLNINTNSFPMYNIYNNFHLLIMQNGRKDNLITKNKPSSFSNNIISFDKIGDIEFYAGNEFRNFDTRRLKTVSNRIRNIEYTHSGYNVFLRPDPNRLTLNYKNYSDINGQFSIINNEDTHRSYDIEADYTNVYFSLPIPYPYTDGAIYIIGDFNDWNIDKKVLMEYDHQKKAYTKTLFLKQGFYDYAYLFIPNNKKQGEIMKLEGSHSETENTYHIFVYYRDQGDYHDRIIGLRSVNSH